MIFGIISISKEFVPIFFGQGYDEVVTLINIISPVVLLMGIANVIGTQYLLPTKRQKEYTISVTAGLIINFFLNWLLISKWGALGASIATVLSQLVVDLFQLKNIKNEIDLISVFKTSIKYLFAGLIMFAFCLVVNLLNLVGWTAIIVKIIVGMIVYFGLLLIFKDEYIYAFITKIFNIIKSKVKNK